MIVGGGAFTEKRYFGAEEQLSGSYREGAGGGFQGPTRIGGTYIRTLPHTHPISLPGSLFCASSAAVVSSFLGQLSRSDPSTYPSRGYVFRFAGIQRLVFLRSGVQVQIPDAKSS